MQWCNNFVRNYLIGIICWCNAYTEILRIRHWNHEYKLQHWLDYLLTIRLGALKVNISISSGATISRAQSELRWKLRYSLFASNFLIYSKLLKIDTFDCFLLILSAKNANCYWLVGLPYLHASLWIRHMLKMFGCDLAIQGADFATWTH